MSSDTLLTNYGHPDTSASHVNHIQNQTGNIEHVSDHDGSDIAMVRDTLGRVVGSHLHAKTVINRRQAKITDLRMRSMRDIIIFKTSVSKYQEVRNEKVSG